MKTLVLSPDDLQNFNKFIYDPKSAAQLAASAGAIGAAAAAAAAVHGPPAGTTVQLLQGSVLVVLIFLKENTRKAGPS